MTERMISATFRIRLSEALWVAQLSTAFPQATFRLLSGYRTEERALELGETITDRPAAVVAAMADHPSIEISELLESDARRALVKYETTDTALYEFVERSSLTIEFPITVQDGWYEFDLTGTRQELDRVQELLEGGPYEYELLSLIQSPDADRLLTTRQREVIETAIRMGYFEIPRTCTLAVVADELGIDKSTASTILRRGEARIIKSFVSGPD
ncbi:MULTISPECIES: helix-turn-helix domain-containing protein [Natrialba]|uniref:Bacterio-opsin activator HTH domain-containing protein n=1 Tax=Natrialba aegyptia DSM 13077 TaxID=1227491 RepID=M0AY86_9EURY|nr:MULTISPECIES: helix-turn-helix domain-containing protein [Natrialba]ELZ03641.1 Bacterio-opsin activator HTH domain-containing protein [Natrialba aegyptia DSM 13077]